MASVSAPQKLSPPQFPPNAQSIEDSPSNPPNPSIDQPIAISIADNASSSKLTNGHLPKPHNPHKPNMANNGNKLPPNPQKDVLLSIRNTAKTLKQKSSRRLRGLSINRSKSADSDNRDISKDEQIENHDAPSNPKQRKLSRSKMKLFFIFTVFSIVISIVHFHVIYAVVYDVIYDVISRYNLSVQPLSQSASQTEIVCVSQSNTSFLVSRTQRGR